jgi:hypothetical protein
MIETNSSVAQAPAMSQAQRQALAQRQARAVAVLVRRSAVEATKQRLAARGIKRGSVAMREIVAMAEARIVADVAWRAKLIAEARAVVDQWTAEGFFGKRAAQSVQHLQVMHSERRPEPQALPLCEYRERNGATQ